MHLTRELGKKMLSLVMSMTVSAVHVFEHQGGMWCQGINPVICVKKHGHTVAWVTFNENITIVLTLLDKKACNRN